jgi:Fe-S cluster assembly protein SufD
LQFNKFVMLKEKTQVVQINNLKGEKIEVEEGSKLTYLFFGTEGWDKSVKLEFHLKGDLDFYAFIVGRDTNKFPLEIVANHLANNIKSRLYCRTALFDQSQIDLKGMMVVKPNVQLADTYLTHRALLLSDKTRAKTVPSMEIAANDVKAGHSATIGKVDKELLFYLKSRGIDEEASKSLLITGFFEEQIQMISDKKIQAKLRDLITKSLPFSLKMLSKI